MAHDGNSTLLVGADRLQALNPYNWSRIWEHNIIDENINFIVIDRQWAYACS
jgi:hypothetical protein